MNITKIFYQPFYSLNIRKKQKDIIYLLSAKRSILFYNKNFISKKRHINLV
jgi:hypothetical protein